jgi:hypothetical protein
MHFTKVEVKMVLLTPNARIKMGFDEDQILTITNQ